jgi:hypothetical protein
MGIIGSPGQAFKDEFNELPELPHSYLPMWRMPSAHMMREAIVRRTAVRVKAKSLPMYSGIESRKAPMLALFRLVPLGCFEVIDCGLDVSLG